MDKNYFERMIKSAYENAKEKGFYTEGEKVNVSDKLMATVEECGEARKAFIKNRFSEQRHIEKHYENRFKIDDLWIELFNHHIHNTFQDETADIFLTLASLAGALKIQEYPFLYENFECHLASKQKYKTILEWLFNFTMALENIKFTHELKIDTAGSFGILFGKLWGFCDKQNIDIEKHIEAKMAFNSTRPYLHK